MQKQLPCFQKTLSKCFLSKPKKKSINYRICSAMQVVFDVKTLRKAEVFLLNEFS
jgi:hypothetical protein